MSLHLQNEEITRSQISKTRGSLQARNTCAAVVTITFISSSIEWGKTTTRTVFIGELC